jgi:hypothetical protein
MLAQVFNLSAFPTYWVLISGETITLRLETCGDVLLAPIYMVWLTVCCEGVTR